MEPSGESPAADGPLARDTRDVIAVAAWQLLDRDRKPWTKITVNDIARQAEVAKSTVFHRFPKGKEEIIDHFVHIIYREASAQIATFEPTAQGMRAAVHRVIWWISRNEPFARLILDDYEEFITNRSRDRGRYRILENLMASAIERYYWPSGPNRTIVLNQRELASVLLPPVLHVISGGIHIYEEDWLDNHHVAPVWQVVLGYMKAARKVFEG